MLQLTRPVNGAASVSSLLEHATSLSQQLAAMMAQPPAMMNLTLIDAATWNNMAARLYTWAADLDPMQA